MADKIRIDLLVTKLGLAESRSKAQDLIAEGLVFYQAQGAWRPVVKSNMQLAPETLVKVENGIANKYVSRGGVKLELALAESGLVVKDKIVLDVGQSTGGFTDCLLQHGASKVVGIDVGHDQLHVRLQKNLQVVCLEKINIREYENHPDFNKVIPDQGFSVIVADLSFISLAMVIAALAKLAAPGGELLMLVKPQFEVGQQFLNRGGIVKDKKAVDQVLLQLKKECELAKIQVIMSFACGIEGRDGNQEYFIYGKKI